MRTPRRILSVGPAALVLAILVGAAPAAAATGQYGVHLLVDNSEYPAVSCTYDSLHVLMRFRIRGPIVFGYDRTSGTDPQTVGWRYRVQSRDVGTAAGPAGPAAWTTRYTSPIVTATATDRRNAPFLAATHLFGPEALDHFDWRVRVDVRWYHPNASTQTGSGQLAPFWYAVKDPPFEPGVRQDFCPASLA